MDTVNTCFTLLSRNCYLASVDLRDAYYSVPVAKQHQKYLKFSWNGNLYQFTAMPNGLACAPRYFTKLMKPVFATLRQKGYISTSYLDDVLLFGDDYESCVDNLIATVHLLQSLGFIIHPEKSVFQPTYTIEHLGFVMNSQNMLVNVNTSKIDNLKKQAALVISAREPSL